MSYTMYDIERRISRSKATPPMAPLDHEQPVLRIKDLRVGYGDKSVISDMNLSVMPGQLVCLLGPNGCGKTTALRTFVGLLPPLEGSVQIAGQYVSSATRRELAKKMAVVLTEPLHLDLMTTYEVVAMGRYPHTGLTGKLDACDEQSISLALEAVGAMDLAERFFSQLSDGERQKVMIARALAQEPELIVLDEPTSHLDVRHKVEVLNILRRLCRTKRLAVACRCTILT